MRSARRPNDKPQELEAFLADLEALKTQQMKTARQLTHSDQGCNLAIKIYSCLTQLAVHYSDFSHSLDEAKSLEEQRSLKENLATLFKLKNQLQRCILRAAKKGLDEMDDLLYKKLNQIETELDSFYNLPRYMHHIEEIAHLNHISSVMYYLTIIASYLTNGIRAFLHTLPTIVSNLGQIFPPITIAMDAAKNIFDLLYSLATYFHLKEIEYESQEELAPSPLYNKGFYIRLAGNSIALALNVFTLLIFTGALFSTPLGWALSAAVIAAEWIAAYIVPVWQARRNHQQVSQDHHGEITPVKTTYLARRKDALWGLCSIVGSIFFACGFVCPPLFYVGVIFLLASPTRFTINYLLGTYRKHTRPVCDEEYSFSSTSEIASQLQPERGVMIFFNREYEDDSSPPQEIELSTLGKQTPDATPENEPPQHSIKLQ